ncbi:MAG: hypothetical protein AAF560_14550 [Acidobacteriota bacterium]
MTWSASSTLGYGAWTSLAACLALWNVGSTTHAQPAPAVGPEFPVNTYTTGNQQHASVAADADGNFVVVWQSDTAPGYSVATILGQRFDSAGLAIGGEFQPSINPDEDNLQPDVAMRPDGEFVVTWISPSIIPGTNFVAVRRHLADASPLDIFIADGSTANASRAPDIGYAADGSMVVVWDDITSGGDDSSGRSVQARRIAADGMPLANEFQVNTYTTDDQENAAVAIADDGSFWVVWESVGSAASPNRGIMGQRFDAAGAPVGDEFRVSINTEEDSLQPDIAATPNGDFVVVWASPTIAPEAKIAAGRRYSSDGTLLEGFIANGSTAGNVRRPAIAVEGDGSFVVAWDDGPGVADLGLEQLGGDEREIEAQRFSAEGAKIGGPFRVNTAVIDFQTRPAVAAADQRFVVVWESLGVDGDGTGIQGQRFDGLIFADGFESGDTSAW